MYDWHAVCRQYKNKKTGDIIWPMKDKTQPAKDRMSMKNALRICQDEYIREKLLVVQPRVRDKPEDVACMGQITYVNVTVKM